MLSLLSHGKIIWSKEKIHLRTKSKSFSTLLTLIEDNIVRTFNLVSYMEGLINLIFNPASAWRKLIILGPVT